jgi:serine phosphatase RsbU (regulator of sigma subunit)
LKKYRFAGYRVVEFSIESKKALRQIAQRLLLHESRILDTWIKHQWNAWQPPGLTRDDLRTVFGQMLRNMLVNMEAGEPAMAIAKLEAAGRELAARRFPFEALITSIHFLEESYMPLLLTNSQREGLRLMIAMDEFLHAALAAIAASYFTAYRRELLDEVEVGRLVQEGLLADIPTQVGDLEIAHAYISAREKARLGGDFLDLFRLDSQRIVFTIGDLSGHGIEAVADSLTIRSLFRGFMRENPDPCWAMARLSRVATAELKPDQFATMLAVVYESNGILRIVGAGHPYPILCDEKCRFIDVPGTAIGVVDEEDYISCEVVLPQGGLFVAYTDGLIEARSSDYSQFGEERLLDAVAATLNTTARGVADHVIDESLRYSAGKFIDDVAVLVLKRR